MRDGTSHFAMVHNDHDSGDDEETPQAVARVLTFAFASTHDSVAMSSLIDSNQKCPAESLSDESPSPVRQSKNPLPNFDLRQLEDDSVLSGDESDGWEAEEDKMAYFFSEQTRKERKNWITPHC